MPLLTLSDVSLAYGHRPLLQRAGLQIDKGERVCLVGRNGAGKSTLLRLITGRAEPDGGEIWRADPLRVSYLEQDPPLPSGQTVFDVVAAGLGDLGRLLGAYHEAVQRAPAAGEAGLHDLADLQQRIEVLDGWNIQQKVETVLTRLDLPADKPVADCSGGVRRRTMLARALVSEPDLLLLDEPTNHMDIAAITWLEQFLLGFPGALVFITHDRAFLRHLATRIVELDRGALTSFPGDFDHYLRRKEAMLEAEEKAGARLDRRLAEHEAWIRQGIKARRTRNQGRVKTLLALRRARAERVAAQGRVRLEAEAGDLSGKIVADLRDVRFAYGGHTVIDGLSARILRGDRVGIIGPNGCGKSTLLKLILGQLKPDSGRVVLGTRLETAYFDQHRADLDPDKSVRENISEGSDYVTLRGRRRHVIGYLRDFLFPAERIDSPVRSLSGGERNRVLLARIFLQPANLLVLDEPTNDLDVETLELLEDLLTDYEGTLLLVSHDRAFVDNVVTSVLAFEGDGRVVECVGGYEDWLAQRAHSARADERTAKGKTEDVEPGGKRERKPEAGRQKLGYREQRELEGLPARIEALELEQRDIEARVTAPGFYREQDKAGITATLGRLEQVRAELEQAYERWEYLEGAG